MYWFINLNCGFLQFTTNWYCQSWLCWFVHTGYVFIQFPPTGIVLLYVLNCSLTLSFCTASADWYCILYCIVLICPFLFFFILCSHRWLVLYEYVSVFSSVCFTCSDCSPGWCFSTVAVDWFCMIHMFWFFTGWCFSTVTVDWFCMFHMFWFFNQKVFFSTSVD